MKKTLRSAVLALALALGLLAERAAAQIPVTDTAHITQTILHYVGRLIEIGQKYQMIYNQYEQIVNQTRQIQLQLQALEKLDTYWFRSVSGAVGQMERTLGWYDLLSHMDPGIDGTFQRTFPGWQPPRDWWAEEEEAATKTLDTLRATYLAQREAHTTTTSHLRGLGEIKEQIRAIDGTEKGLEVLAEIAAFQAEGDGLDQLSRATSADAATAFYSYQLNRQMRQAIAVQKAITTSDLHPPQYSSAGGWGALPTWWR